MKTTLPRASSNSFGLLAVFFLGVTTQLHSEVILYETGFEPFEGYLANKDLLGQRNWTGYATDLSGLSTDIGGNGILSGPIPGFLGQCAYIGFTAPGKTADFNVWQPVTLKPTARPFPLVRFRVSFQIEDSTPAAPYFDDFRWSFYNTDSHRFFSLDFDNDQREVHFILDEENPSIRPTGFTFENSVRYDLEVDLNLERNEWTARVNGTEIIVKSPITSSGAALSFGDADAAWILRKPGNPGDNYMLFDDYRIAVEPLSNLPFTLEPVGLLNTGAFLVRIHGEPGVTYRLESSDDLLTWVPVGTATCHSPGAYVDLQDVAARQSTHRSYRAVSLP